MSAAVVVDASVWVSRLLTQDLHHRASSEWLERRVADGTGLAGPITMLAEIAGAIARRTENPQLGRRAVDAVLTVPGVRLVEVDRDLGILAYELAADGRMRGADALYVAVASRLRIPLASLDLEQLERARPFGAAVTSVEDG